MTRITGRVKWFNDAKEFGFEVREGPKGLQAANVTKVWGRGTCIVYDTSRSATAGWCKMRHRGSRKHLSDSRLPSASRGGIIPALP